MKTMHNLGSYFFLIFLFTITTFFSTNIQESFAYKPVTNPRCNEFTFDATGSHDPDKENISFHWDFGDGQTSTDPIIEHTYYNSGDYTAILTITDNSGLECSHSTAKQVVRVNIPPKAILKGGEEKICSGVPISFDSSESYDDSKGNLDIYWDFGDKTNDYGKKVVTKTYSKGGSYKVSLKVTDNGEICSEDIAERVIEVNEPPIADAGEKQVLKCVTETTDMTASFDASNSRDTNNDNLTYTWDFGDGETEKGKKVTHKFNRLGNYDVKLIVDDNTNLGCGTSVDFITVRFNEAPKAEAGEDLITCPHEIISFDGGQSYVNKKGTLDAKWFFGDGQSTNGLKVNHTYSKPGIYQASLSVKNRLNEMCPTSKDTKTVTVNAPPTVGIKSVAASCVNNEIVFDASSAIDSDGDKLEFYWTFGDGTTQKGSSKISHVYQQGGTFKVSVVVDDKKRSNCSTATASTEVLVNTSPVADSGPNLSCCVDKGTTFDARASTDADGDELSYVWDFGDGTKTEGAMATHIYGKSGSYNVSLTVTDNTPTACRTSTDSFVAEVNTAPVPVMNIR